VVIVDADLLDRLAEVHQEDLGTVKLVANLLPLWLVNDFFFNPRAQVVVCGHDEKAGGWENSPAHRLLASKLGQPL